jgi:hypothetical protein
MVHFLPIQRPSRGRVLSFSKLPLPGVSCGWCIVPPQSTPLTRLKSLPGPLEPSSRLAACSRRLAGPHMPGLAGHAGLWVFFYRRGDGDVFLEPSPPRKLFGGGWVPFYPKWFPSCDLIFADPGCGNSDGSQLPRFPPREPLGNLGTMTLLLWRTVPGTLREHCGNTGNTQNSDIFGIGFEMTSNHNSPYSVFPSVPGWFPVYKNREIVKMDFSIISVPFRPTHQGY